jgi:polysaccharide pyruvyl transferase WcaK-like protein
MVPKHHKVGLLYHGGGGNLGDDGSIEAVIQNIKGRWPDATICGFSMNPGDTQSRHGIRSYAIRSRTWNFGQPYAAGPVTLKDQLKTWARRFPFAFKVLAEINTVFCRIPKLILKEIVFLAKAFRTIRSFDLFIIAGGGQFLDSSGGPWKFIGGPWSFPYTIFKWLLLARLANVRRIILNVGAGPLVHPLSKFFVKYSCSLAEYVSFRDDHSRVVAHQIGFRGQAVVLPDSVYTLPLPTLPATVADPRFQSVVGISPMAYGDPRLSRRHDPAIYDSYIHKFASFAGWLTDHEHSVKLFCSDIGIDPPAADDVERVLTSRTTDHGRSSNQLQRIHNWTTSELLGNMSSMDYVVTCRFHGIVFAHLLNIPVLAVSHHPKMTGLMDELGLAKYCVDIRSMELALLTDTFMALMENRCDVKDRMGERLASYKKRLTAQFDRLFPRELIRPAVPLSLHSL